ncbi:MAG: hypothetical protein ACPGJV_04935 [Bacteriovoracaceae bacterium]
MILVAGNSYANKFEVYLHTIGKKSLILKDNIEVSIVNFDEQLHDTHRSWKSKLVVKKDSKVIFEKYPIITDFKESYSYFLVPIKKSKYALDLNSDNFPEFAIAVDHGGNAPSTSAVVYSVKNDTVSIYKKAWYQQENGQEVIWDYANAPRKCYYTSQNKCEYL